MSDFIEKLSWSLTPDWRRDLDLWDALEQFAATAEAHEQDAQKKIQRLEQRITELEDQLLALETHLSEQGIPMPPPEPEEQQTAHTAGEPVTFPRRTEELITCPVCGRRQRGSRDACYYCGTLFQYES